MHPTVLICSTQQGEDLKVAGPTQKAKTVHRLKASFLSFASRPHCGNSCPSQGQNTKWKSLDIFFPVGLRRWGSLTLIAVTAPPKYKHAKSHPALGGSTSGQRVDTPKKRDQTKSSGAMQIGLFPLGNERHERKKSPHRVGGVILSVDRERA